MYYIEKTAYTGKNCKNRVIHDDLSIKECDEYEFYELEDFSSNDYETSFYGPHSSIEEAKKSAENDFGVVREKTRMEAEFCDHTFALYRLGEFTVLSASASIRYLDYNIRESVFFDTTDEDIDGLIDFLTESSKEEDEVLISENIAEFIKEYRGELIEDAVLEEINTCWEKVEDKLMKVNELESCTYGKGCSPKSEIRDLKKEIKQYETHIAGLRKKHDL